MAQFITHIFPVNEKSFWTYVIDVRFEILMTVMKITSLCFFKDSRMDREESSLAFFNS
jgi:hypothetical protein